MIGNAKFNYATRDIVQLVKKDLVDKLGNRELAPFDLSVPGVVTTKSKISVYPNPQVKEITVKEQINALGLPTKPDIPRSDGSVGRDSAFVGGEDIIAVFDRKTNVLTLSGGPVKWTAAGESNQNTAGHWVGVKIGFPLGWIGEVGQIISYTHNGVPKYLVLDEPSIENKCINMYFDAALTTNDLVITWSNDYNPENLSIVIKASLEDSAVRKIPEFPKTSKFEFSYPSAEEFVAADIAVDVDLSLGK